MELGIHFVHFRIEHDVFLAEDGDKFAQFVGQSLMPILNPFNPHSVVMMDNASIHIGKVSDLIEQQAGARLCFLPPYLPDLNPCESVFSQIKSMMKDSQGICLIITKSFTSNAICNCDNSRLQWSYFTLRIHVTIKNEKC